VLDGAAGVMTNEGHGLGETEKAVMVVRAGKGWTRFELTCSRSIVACLHSDNAYLPALNRWPKYHGPLQSNQWLYRTVLHVVGTPPVATNVHFPFSLQYRTVTARSAN
jgi:hypothetical protein